MNKLQERLGGNPATPEAAAAIFQRMLPANLAARAMPAAYQSGPFAMLPANAQGFAAMPAFEGGAGMTPAAGVDMMAPPPMPAPAPEEDPAVAGYPRRGGPAAGAPPAGPYQPAPQLPPEQDDTALLLAALGQTGGVPIPVQAARGVAPQQQEQPFYDPAFEPRTTKRQKKVG